MCSMSWNVLRCNTDCDLGGLEQIQLSAWDDVVLQDLKIAQHLLRIRISWDVMLCHKFSGVQTFGRNVVSSC